MVNKQNSVPFGHYRDMPIRCKMLTFEDLYKLPHSSKYISDFFIQVELGLN